LASLKLQLVNESVTAYQEQQIAKLILRLIKFMMAFDAFKPWTSLGDDQAKIPQIWREVAWLRLMRAKQVPQ